MSPDLKLVPCKPQKYDFVTDRTEIRESCHPNLLLPIEMSPQLVVTKKLGKVTRAALASTV